VGVTETLTGATSDTVEVAVFVVSATLMAVTVTALELDTVEGAVYNPLVEIVPTAGFSDHVTAVFVAPETVAVNCLVCAAVKLAAVGLTETLTGAMSDTVALPVFVLSAALVAVTVTELVLEIVAGAVYKPPVEIVPTAGFNDQVTVVFAVPETAAANC
jgi:hypothetical protein